MSKCANALLKQSDLYLHILTFSHLHIGILSIIANSLSAELLVGHVTTIEDGETIAEGAFDAPVEYVAFERTPIAFALNAVGRKRPRHMGTHHDDVGFVAFA